MLRLRELVRFGLPWLLCIGCQPSNLQAGGLDGGQANGVPPSNAVLVFGPTNFADALRFAQSPIKCGTGMQEPEEWHVNPLSMGTLSTLEFLATANVSSMAAACVFRVNVPISNGVDLNQYSKGFIQFDSSYMNSLGFMNLTVQVNNSLAVDYLGKKSSSPIMAKIGGAFAAGMLPGEVSVEFSMNSQQLFQNDNWIVSNVSVYAIK